MITRKDKKFTEQVWHVGKGRRVNGRGGATGGGVSMLYDRPKWQDVSIKSVNKKSIDGRVVPDITALAGPPMYDLVFDGDDDFGGGTSASAPVLAALIARIYALLPKNKRRRFLTPLLYRKSPQGTPMGISSAATLRSATTRPFRSRAEATRPPKVSTLSPAGARRSENRFCWRLLERFADGRVRLAGNAKMYKLDN